MEHSTPFDLNAALQNWREELVVQPQLMAEDRRELETHVNDTMAEMRQRGLNEEESFWLARRRVGQLRELGDEFAKTEPARSAREWVLWIAIVFYGMVVWQRIVVCLSLLITFRLLPTASVSALVMFAPYFSLVLFGIYMARRRSLIKFTTWHAFIRRWGRLFTVSSFLIIEGIQIATIAVGGNHMTPQLWGLILLNSSGPIWPLMLVAMILWLWPSGKARTLEYA